MSEAVASLFPAFDQARALELLSRILKEAPHREPTSDDERRAQEIMEGVFKELGLETAWERFTFNDNLYANVALHFGLGTLGTVVSGAAPLAGFLMHMAAGTSYWADSTRRAYLLRRLLPFKPSHNLLATLPAEGKPDLRVVVAAHADAAFTGWIFHEDVVRGAMASHTPKFVKRSLALATGTQFALAGCDLARLVFGPLAWPLRPLEWLLTLPSALTLATMLDVVLRHKVVPGANDDLSGVVMLPVLAARLAQDKPKNVELVFAVTGCEEASLGGGDALARAHQEDWDRTKTVFVALDCMTNGVLSYAALEGEVVRVPSPTWLRDVAAQTASENPRFSGVKPFEIPVGGTDAAAFLNHGFDALALVCMDPALGSPKHYHLESDTAENLDVQQLLDSTDYTEALIRNIIRHRVRNGHTPS